MPIRKIDGTDVEYYLVAFDERCMERREPDGTLMSETVQQRAADAEAPVTDVFFASHGWKGDVPAAIEQYDSWIGTMAAMWREQRRGGFAPLIVGLHWPSLPWGDETIPAGSGAVLSARDELEAQVDAYASRIAETPVARAALRSILEAARHDSDPTTLSSAIRDAYATLFAESELASSGPSGRPGTDQDGFDPAAIIADARAGGETVASGTPGLLSFSDTLRDAREALLMPLRQLSFWKMKDRARLLGETSGHELLRRLLLAAPNARFHLMGHSFGCIVVSATVAGAPNGAMLPRPVNSLFLVQGAFSIWSYASEISYAPGTVGYFSRIVKDGLVRGPIVTTQSKYDTANGIFYPMGAKLKRQFVLGELYPLYGPIGTFGIRGVAGVYDMTMQSATFAYDFRGGCIYNLEASGIIRNGGGLSGAHSDIAHPEVAHAFLAAVLARFSPSPPYVPYVVPQPRGGGLLDAESDAQPPSPPYVPYVVPDSLPRGGGLLDAEPDAQPPSPMLAEKRWLNAELENHPRDEPLATGRWYTLAFDIDVARHPTAIGSEPIDVDKLFPEGTDEVLLTVQLDSADFTISDHTLPLQLLRLGRSTKARFNISPLQDGTSAIKATIHKHGNFVQQMELTFEVGATRATPVQVTARGLPPGAVGVLQARDVLLVMSLDAGGYDCVVCGAVSGRARLPLQPTYLANAIDTARQELMKVVEHQNAAGEYVFQTRTDVPDADSDFALNTMARAGALLFQNLFFGPAAGADSMIVGGYLRRMASDSTTRLKLQIVAESTPVPWGLLYIASVGSRLDWDNFIGMRHLIDQKPLQSQLIVSNPRIPSDKPQLTVSVNVNSGIDAQARAHFVAQQQSFWADATASRRHVRVTSRTKVAEVVQALADGTTDDQILYFYCHAASKGLADAGGPDASCLVLTDGRITLANLKLDAPTTTLLRGNPLVFINACESAEMSPAFYDGFVPYFMAKGARGVIGTECKTPALFAAAWAKQFFERFLDGEPLGEAFLRLRRGFLEKHRNPLGLLYAVHCDGDTEIQPAV